MKRLPHLTAVIAIVYGMLSLCMEVKPCAAEAPLAPVHTNYQRAMLMVAYQRPPGQSGKSIAYWDSLLNVSVKLDMPYYEARIQNKIGYLYHLGNNAEKALAHLNKSFLIASSQHYEQPLFEVLNSLVKYHGIHANRRQVLQYAYQMLRMANELGNEQQKGNAYSALALYYLSIEDYEKALTLHMAFYKLCLRTNNHLGCASALSDVACDYLGLGDEAKAAYYYLLSGKFANELSGTLEEIALLTNVASAYRLLHQPDSGMYYGRLAYEKAHIIRSKYAIASTAVCLGVNYVKDGNGKEALKYANEANRMVQEVTFTSQIPDLLTLYRSAYEALHDYKNALEVADRRRLFMDSISGETARRLALEQSFQYKVALHQRENKLLFQQNSIQALQLKQKQTLVVIMLLVVLLGLGIAIIWVRHQRTKANYQLVQLEQKLLYTQMNPHFIFNSLSAIQQLVMQSNNRQAETYLSKFSRLMRELLESSNRDTQVLSTEITMLNTYLEMESLRFNAAFNYQIYVSKELAPEAIYIPHLMIQPFVENAIWHGLLPHNGVRSLEISISPGGEGKIKCVINDNGIGRKAAAMRNQELGKKSMAVELVTKRLKLIKSVLGITGSLTYTDKLFADGSAAGTTVELVLPVIKTYL